MSTRTPCPECGSEPVDWSLTPVDCKSGTPTGNEMSIPSICPNKSCWRFAENTEVDGEALRAYYEELRVEELHQKLLCEAWDRMNERVIAERKARKQQQVSV